MGYVGSFVGLVALVQGAAWLGGGPKRRRTVAGAITAPLGLALFVLSLLHLMVPGFFAGS